MLTFVLALVQAAAPVSARLDLQCTAIANNRREQWTFSIDRRTGAYAGRQDATAAFSGMASVTADRIVLRNEQDRITWYYHVDRRTGDLTVAGGLPGHDRVFNQVRGTCRGQ